jgi:glycosyltransferase involved in cell wall biosynthesis
VSDRMRVGLNLLFLVETSGGTGSYARELMPALLREEPGLELTAFVNRDAPESLLSEPWAGEVDWVRIPFRLVHAGLRGNVLSMASQWGALPVLAARRRIDVVHGLANVVPLVSPSVATVVTLLDLIWLRFPDTMARWPTFLMKQTAPRCARSADRVIAISEFARRDLEASLSLDPGKIDVTPLGVADERPAAGTPEAELRDRLRLGDGPVVLCVSQQRPHKNLASLIRALPLLDAERPRLVLTGARTEHQEELRALAVERGVQDQVVFPGWVSERDLDGLYGLARCFALPSLDEGFGLPLLEAMRHGVPVACSKVSSMPEVAGDAALLFDPRDVGDIAAQIGRLLRDGELRAELVRRGRERCREFPWSRTARETLRSYRRAVSGRS